MTMPTSEETTQRVRAAVTARLVSKDDDATDFITMLMPVDDNLSLNEKILYLAGATGAAVAILASFIESAADFINNPDEFPVAQPVFAIELWQSFLLASES